MDIDSIRTILGAEADLLLAAALHGGGLRPRARLLPGPDFVDRAWGGADHSPAWRRNFQSLFDAGRLAGTGYLCLLDMVGPIDDPCRFAELAVDGGCSGLVLDARHLDAVAPRYAHRVPLVVGLPVDADAATLRRVRDLGVVGIEAAHSPAPQDVDAPALVARAAAEGLPVLLCPHVAAAEPGVTGALAAAGAALVSVDLAGPPALRPRPSKALLDATGDTGLGPDAVQAALATLRAGYARGGRAVTLGTVPWSGGDPLRRALRAAVLQKRAGGFGLVAGLAATERPFDEAVALLHAVQDVYACGSITLAG
jgi:class I fructose-bisphosphate aldolase